MRGLDLFSGIGGLCQALLPWSHPIAYCEREPYAQAVLLQKISAGELPNAPIWDDVRTLRGDMLPAVDIIYGGFPCQDISAAGRGAGLGGERSSMYWELHRLIRECAPPFVFLENSPAIRTRGLTEVAESLTVLGYDLRWTVISASSVGAPHQRNRWFCLAAHPDRIGLRDRRERSAEGEAEAGDQPEHHGPAGTLAYTDGLRLQVPSTELSQGGTEGGAIFRSRATVHGGWTVEPDVGRVVHGLPFRVDRLRGLGNAVVPLQAQTAFKILTGVA